MYAYSVTITTNLEHKYWLGLRCYYVVIYVYIYITSPANVLSFSFLDISVLKGFIIFSSLKQNFGKYSLHTVSLKIRVNDQPEPCLFTRG